MAIRVLLLTQWFDPEPTFKGLVFARALVEQGFEVEVITGFPNYPGGKIYPGYNLKWLQREEIDGVRITRVPLYPSHDKSAVGRIANYLTFAATSLLYGLFGAKRADVIYAYHPPLTVGIAAVFIRFFRGIPVVYDIQDMWPDTLRATGMISNARALNLVGHACNWVYRYVDRLVVLSPGFKTLLIQRNVPSEKIDLIYNWCSEGALMATNDVKRPLGVPDGKFVLLFAGNMGRAQSLHSVLDAAALLRVQAPSVQFVFLGAGVELPLLQATATNKGLLNVTFLPAVAMEEVGPYLAAADALLVHLTKDPLFKITIPSKTQAYMAAGRPILMAVDGDAADLITQSGCGVIAESENPESIANAAMELVKLTVDKRLALGARARKFYDDNLSLTHGTTEFGRIFRKLATKKA